MTNPPDRAVGGARRGGNEGTFTVAHTGDARSYRMRRWARLSLDELLDVQAPELAEPRCDGSHHPDLPCDWWSTCTSLSAGLPERAARGRELVRSGYAA